MSSGVFAVARSVFDHDVFAKEPFTEREAWIWLIGEAAWRARRARAGNAMIDLSRGQCAFSIRFMAARWQWSKSRVERFLKRLKLCAMVEFKTGTPVGTGAGQGVTVITICKYNEYQKVSLPTETPDGTASGTEAGQKRDKLEDRENIKSIIKEDTLRGAVAPTEAEIFKLGKLVLGKSAGGVIVKLKAHCDGDLSEMLGILRDAGEKDSPMEWVQAVLRGPDRIEREIYRYVDCKPLTPEQREYALAHGES